MQVLSDRVAYLKGLAEGLSIGETSKEGRLIGAVIDVLGDVVKVLSELKDKHQELDEYVESIDEDLAELEEALLDEDDPDDDDTMAEYVGIRETSGLNRHILVFGATGSGKSRGFVRPFIMQTVRRRDRCLCHSLRRRGFGRRRRGRPRGRRGRYRIGN